MGNYGNLMVQANMDFEKALARHTLYVLPRKVLGVIMSSRRYMQKLGMGFN